MIDRRQLLTMAAAVPAMGAMGGLAKAAALPDLSKLRVRTPAGPCEVIYKTPHGNPNGMYLTPEGMWIIDQSAGNWASLINPATGALIREVVPEAIQQASGICIDDQGVMWIGSTYNRLVVAVNATDGKLIAKYSTPGAGQIYSVKGDPAQRSTTLQRAYPPAPPAGGAAAAGAAAGGGRGAAAGGGRGGGGAGRGGGGAARGAGQVAGAEGPAGTGAHCILAKGPNMYVAVPPARSIFVIDKATWQVQDAWQTGGNRPHDMTWTDASRTKLWAADSNMNAFFLHDVATGQMTERLQLPSDSPVIHGAKLYNGYMYCCDDVGWMWRFRMPT